MCVDSTMNSVLNSSNLFICYLLFLLIQQTFSHHTWVRTNVKRSLGVDEADPTITAMHNAIQALRSSWDRVGGRPEFHKAQHNFERMEESGSFGVTVRFRRSVTKERGQW